MTMLLQPRYVHHGLRNQASRNPFQLCQDLPHHHTSTCVSFGFWHMLLRQRLPGQPQRGRAMASTRYHLGMCGPKAGNEKMDPVVLEQTSSATCVVSQLLAVRRRPGRMFLGWKWGWQYRQRSFLPACRTALCCTACYCMCIHAGASSVALLGAAILVAGGWALWLDARDALIGRTNSVQRVA